MQSILYTDTDRVRSVLGIDEQDVSDSQITARDLEKELKLDLTTWLPTHAALFSAGDSPAATDSEQGVSDSITLYCTYFCATLVIKSLQMLAPQSISDGKNNLARFTTIDWKGMESFTKERSMFYRTFLLDATASTILPPTYTPFTAVVLGTDPVTSAQ